MTIVLLLLGVFGSSVSHAAGCPPVPSEPTPTSADTEFYESWRHVDEPYRVNVGARDADEPALGVGYLEVTNVDIHHREWPRNIVLPVWEEPSEEAFYGWVHHGRMHPLDDSPPYPLTGAGLVETDYEQKSFIVYEALKDGWLRIRLTPGKDGVVWTHRCRLEMGDAKLAYKDWTSFLKEHSSRLYFRSEVSHTLRKAPGTDSERVALIGLDHNLVLHEIRGDWMRVSAEQPSTTCGRERESTIHEGWVKWRDEEKGPWVWTSTRGC